MTVKTEITTKNTLGNILIGAGAAVLAKHAVDGLVSIHWDDDTRTPMPTFVDVGAIAGIGLGLLMKASAAHEEVENNLFEVCKVIDDMIENPEMELINFDNVNEEDDA